MGNFFIMPWPQKEVPWMAWMTMLNVYRTVLAPVYPYNPSDYCQLVLSEFYHVAVTANIHLNRTGW